MSTIDTSTWNPDADLNTDIGGIPLTADAGIAQTWQALRILMAAVKGDGDAIKSMIDVMQGATASADGASGLVPKPLAGDQDKVLKGDGTWGSIPAPNLGTASRAVQTDANGALAVSSVTSTELGHLSGVTSAIQTQLNAKAADSGVVHLAGAETITGAKTFGTTEITSTGVVKKSADTSYLLLCGGSSNTTANGSRLELYGTAHASNSGIVRFYTGKINNSYSTFVASPDGTLTWNGQSIQTSSDERLKTPLASVPDEVLDAWEAVGWGQYQFLDAVERKGEAARLHLGLIAQRVKAVFEARGMDACEYGILCREEREGTADEPAVDLWMVRYEEALAMEAACQRRRADRLEARIAALEERMNG